MKYASKDYIINTVYRTNILPVISECNTACIFCSHRQNPPEVEVFRMPKMSLEDFSEIIGFLSPDKKIIIGESATRIIEGEPLLYKDILQLLALIRERYGNTPIQITTNAILLSGEIVDELEKIGGIELNISVNCADPVKRSKILGLKQEDDIKGKIKRLEGRFRFCGSMVYVPGLLTKSDVEEMVSLMQESRAEALRIFMPGYTRLVSHDYNFIELCRETEAVVTELRRKYDIPIIVEPTLISSIECRIEGIISGTPAALAGVKVGDVIVSIGGIPVKTRVDGFDNAFRLSNPELKVRRGTELLDIKLRKPRNSRPGFVVLFDIEPDALERINAVAERHCAKNILIMTSELAYRPLYELVMKDMHDYGLDVIPVENRYFGGTIRCAGLLTIEDVLYAFSQYAGKGKKPDLILLPPIMFDFRNRDLLGVELRCVQEKLGIAVDTV